MSKKKEYAHPIYGDGLAPIECQQKLTLPAHWQRGAIRRFEKACKSAGVFYLKNGHTITLAFASKLERDSNISWFKKQLELNGEEFKEA